MRLGRGAFARHLAGSVALSALFAATPSMAQSDKPVNFDITAPDLADALNQFAQQSDQQIIFSTDTARGRRTQSLHGSYAPDQALRILLRNTGLTFKVSENNTIIIGPEGTNQTPRPSRLGDASQALPSEGGVEEIVVTAQKHEERLRDVPAPVTVLDAQALVEHNQLRLADYFSSVPGLNFTSSGTGDMYLAIRGVTTGTHTNQTVAVTVDDVPYGPTSTYATNGDSDAPDFDPSDLARIEVLRGPQGTLYGASSIGGLLKYVTVDPSIEGFSGRLEADLSGVHNAADVGYGLRGAVNVPLGEDLAVRASGFTRGEPGYVDDPALHLSGVNHVNVYGGRLSALWRPSDTLSLKLSAKYQDTTGDGISSITLQPGLGDLQQVFSLPVNHYRKQSSLYTAVLSADLGGIDLTSTSGYSVDDNERVYDATGMFGSYASSVFNVSGSDIHVRNKTDIFTQEIRLSSSIWDKLDWTLGAFYTYQNNNPNVVDFLAVNPSTVATVGDLITYSNPLTYEEYAGFGDLTWHITDEFDIQVGARESQNKQSYKETDTGSPQITQAFDGYPPPVIYPPIHTTGTSFTYLVTPRFKVSPDLMLYARVASGYRPGGPNLGSLFNVPRSYQADTTVNYEVGAKGYIFDHLLSFDASVYYVDWSRIQIDVLDVANFVGYLTNGSSAKSEGAELSVEVRPLGGLTIAAWFAWNDATLTQDLPTNSTAIGFAGNRLPFSSRLSGNLSIDDEFSVTGEVTGFVGGAVSYVGDRAGEFAGNTFGSGPQPPRFALPSYVKADLRAGARYQSWTATLFLNNISDKRGVLNGGIGAFVPGQITETLIQPRTFGLSVTKTF